MNTPVSQNSPSQGLPSLKFDRFNNCQNLKHGLFTREGGISRQPFDTLNVGLDTGDDPQAVLENRRRIIRDLGGGQPVFLNQVHGTDIAVFKNHGKSLERITDIAGDPIEADGSVTNIPGLILFIQVADCQPILLFDPIKRVAANLHSGWRGSILNIAGKGVRTMVEEFGCSPADILAGIGPSLGPCCAEFIHYREEIPAGLWHYQVKNNHFDFWQITTDQLQEQGIKPDNIAVSRQCSKCSGETFFSYRKERITGRLASAIKIDFSH